MDVERTSWDKVLDIATWVFLMLFMMFSAYAYVTLPGIEVATDDVVGEAPKPGDASIAVLILAAVAMGMIILLKTLMKYPHRFNYLVRITPENAKSQYTTGVRMLRLAGLVTVLLFFFITMTLYLEALGMIPSAIIWIVTSVLILGPLPFAYFLIASRRNEAGASQP